MPQFTEATSSDLRLGDGVLTWFSANPAINWVSLIEDGVEIDSRFAGMAESRTIGFVRHPAAMLNRIINHDDYEHESPLNVFRFETTNEEDVSNRILNTEETAAKYQIDGQNGLGNYFPPTDMMAIDFDRDVLLETTRMLRPGLQASIKQADTEVSGFIRAVGLGVYGPIGIALKPNQWVSLLDVEIDVVLPKRGTITIDRLQSIKGLHA